MTAYWIEVTSDL